MREWCVFRHYRQRSTLPAASAAPFRKSPKRGIKLKSIIAEPYPEIAESAEKGCPARWALASLSLSILLPSLGISIANVGLPTLAEAFNATFQQVRWVVLAYLLTVTALIVSVGRLGYLMKRRRLLLIGVAVFTVASVLCGIAPTLWLFIAVRAAQGVGAAITMAFVAEIFPKAKTGGAMGPLGTMSAVGTALGPSLGGVLIAGPG